MNLCRLAQIIEEKLITDAVWVMFQAKSDYIIIFLSVTCIAQFYIIINNYQTQYEETIKCGTAHRIPELSVSEERLSETETVTLKEKIKEGNEENTEYKERK